MLGVLYVSDIIHSSERIGGIGQVADVLIYSGDVEMHMIHHL